MLIKNLKRSARGSRPNGGCEQALLCLSSRQSDRFSIRVITGLGCWVLGSYFSPAHGIQTLTISVETSARLAPFSLALVEMMFVDTQAERRAAVIAVSAAAPSEATGGTEQSAGGVFAQTSECIG